MPIYDYVCAQCGQVTEVIHGIEAPGPKFCPACGREGTLRKSFAPPAVLFKGSGWAKKDRSSTSSPRTKAGAASGDADGASKASGESATSSSKSASDAPPSPAAGTGSSSTPGGSARGGDD